MILKVTHHQSYVVLRYVKDHVKAFIKGFRFINVGIAQFNSNFQCTHTYFIRSA